MAILKKIIFISDLHLEESQPVINQYFCSLLQNADASILGIYILGDLFEAWIGDDDNSEFHQKIKSAFKIATQRGIPIYILHGNRDFLLGKKFFAETGCQFIADETKVDLFGTPCLLMHGDTLCTRDHAYLKTRKLVRNKFIQTLFLLLPLRLRKKIAAQMRMQSQQHTQTATAEIMDVTQQEVVNVMQRNAVQYLIHGHTHRPAFHAVVSGERIVLGAWHERGNMLIWDETGKKSWVEFTAETLPQLLAF